MVSEDELVEGVIDWESAGYFPLFWIATKASVSPGLNLYPAPPGCEESDWREALKIELERLGFPQANILITLLSALVSVNAAPAAGSSTCVKAIGFPSITSACLPVKAEGVNASPTPKFLFSAGNYCATFEGQFASITLIPDSVPAGKTCTLFTFTGAGCTGVSKESAESAGCI
ncbi:MAG: hypothetical protein Q9178_003428 [Gyalolechia marmorata]